VVSSYTALSVCIRQKWSLQAKYDIDSAGKRCAKAAKYLCLDDNTSRTPPIANEELE
jgi:hypothetical protein